jgi:hypothetical protein
MARRMHPEGMAALVAAILVTGDVASLPPDNREDAMMAVIDYRRTQVLELAREHYKVNPCDFDTSRETWRQDEGVRNATNNLAKLNRANLMYGLPRS